MQDAPQSDWRSSLRTIVFAAMAAGVLVSLAFPFGALPADSYARGRGERYRRAGDTFVRMLYLSQLAGMREGQGKQFLEQARLQYLVSLEAAPEEERTLISLALVLSALDQKSEAAVGLYNLLRQELPPAERQGLIATLTVLGSQQPSPQEIDHAADYLRTFAAGPLILARAYERAGRSDAAAQAWDAARAEGLRLAAPAMAMVAICGVLLAAGMIGLAVFIIGRVRDIRSGAGRSLPGPQPHACRAREAVEALILWLFLAQVCRLTLDRMLPAERAAGTLAFLLPGVAAGLAAIGWVWLASPRSARLGWRLPGAWRRLIAGISAAGLFALPVIGLNQIIQNLYLRYALSQQTGLRALPEEHPLIPVITGVPTWPSKVVLIVAACAVVPALEETLFRGIIYGALRREWSFAPAALASALVFAVAHLSAIPVAPYLVLGVLFAYLYERYGSLLAPWAAHGAFNGFNLAIVLTLYR